MFLTEWNRVIERHPDYDLDAARQFNAITEYIFDYDTRNK